MPLATNGVAQKHSIGTVLRFTAIFAAFASTLAAAATNHLIKRVPISGDEGWDYITADTEGVLA
jgi:hypothetical protein